MPKIQRFIHILRGLWSNQVTALWLILAFVLTIVLGGGCVNRAPYVRMLDTRAGYSDAPDDEEVALYQRGRHAQDSVLQRAAPRVAKVYIFPHELPTRDYFWGGYVSLLIAQDQWVLDPTDENLPPVAGIKEHKPKHSIKHKKQAPVKLKQREDMK